MKKNDARGDDQMLDDTGITAMLIGATPENREWVPVRPGSVRFSDRWRRVVGFVNDETGEVWVVPGRDGTIAGWRRIEDR